MALKPEGSITASLAVIGVVWGIHSNLTPSNADMQALPAGNADVDAAERKATWTSAGVVCAISLIAKDPGIFVLGSAACIAMAWMSRHAVWTESKTSALGGMATQNVISPDSLSQTPATETKQMNVFTGAGEYL
jgi:hypothetical protein